MQKTYYEIAREGSFNKTHPTFGLIQKYSRYAKRILDLGCGEGTRLSLIENKYAIKIGVDVSFEAIQKAKKQYPSLKFLKVENKLPFKDKYFGFVYSAFVLEHTEDPENFVRESLRVLALGGKILLVAPNFGAPNRISPNNTGNRFIKLLEGSQKDISLLFSSRIENLDWQKVASKKTYEFIDADTRVEPYLLSLLKFIEGEGIKVVKKSFLWEMEQTFSIFQLPFKILGNLGVLPFSYWGPHLLLVGEKHE